MKPSIWIAPVESGMHLTYRDSDGWHITFELEPARNPIMGFERATVERDGLTYHVSWSRGHWYTGWGRSRTEHWNRTWTIMVTVELTEAETRAAHPRLKELPTHETRTLLSVTLSHEQQLDLYIGEPIDVEAA